MGKAILYHLWVDGSFEEYKLQELREDSGVIELNYVEEFDD